MNYKRDLHLHSNLSDGDYSIEEIFKIAKKKGLKAISISDHNTWRDFEKKEKEAKRYSVEHILGIEISTSFKGMDVHILGYASKFRINILRKGLQETIQGYNKRAASMVKKLKEAEIVNLDFKKIKKQKGKDFCVTKYDLAKAIAPILKISNRQALKLVDRGGPAYIPYGAWAMSPGAAIKLIHQAGGIAILAHPGEIYNKFVKKFKITKGKQRFKQLIDYLIKNKIDGLEAYSPKNSLIIKKLSFRIITENNLVASGGSDWHGEKHHPELKMASGGLTEEQFKKLKKHINKKG